MVRTLHTHPSRHSAYVCKKYDSVVAQDQLWGRELSLPSPTLRRSRTAYELALSITRRENILLAKIWTRNPDDEHDP